TEPELMNELLQLAGQETFPYRKLEESCRYFYSDGCSVTLPVDEKKLIDVFTSQFGESEQKVKRYLSRVKKNYEAVKPVFIEVSLHRFRHLLNTKLFHALSRIPFYGLRSSMNDNNKLFFSNPKTVQLFNRFATYNGSSPYKSPGMLNIISHLELNIGPAMPIGGMVEITKKTYEACKSMGVKFNFSEKVNQITLSENRVCGITTNKNTYQGDVVVSNMDVHFTYEKLLPLVKAPTNILNQEKSSSAIVFYWGVKAKVNALGVHNIIFAEDYLNEFECLFKMKTQTNDPTVYIHITSKVEE
ncbi:MAG: phytoene desaturase family protein, partial [Crocinitomicaceae bacterium]